MKNFIKYVIGGSTLALLFCSCSVQQRAQHHLNKAVRLDPSILKQDTLEVVIPKVEIDTFYLTDTLGLQGDIDSIFINYPDTCKELIKPIIKYITEYQYLKDTVYFEKRILNDSINILLTLKGWQVGDSLFLNASLNEGKILKNINTVTIKDSFFDKKSEIILIFLIILLTILLIIKQYGKF